MTRVEYERSSRSQQAVDAAFRIGGKAYPTGPIHDWNRLPAAAQEAGLRDGFKSGFTDAGGKFFTIDDRPDLRTAHRDLVASAIESGRPVPPEVLAEYPDATHAVSAEPAPHPQAQAVEPVAGTGEQSRDQGNGAQPVHQVESPEPSIHEAPPAGSVADDTLNTPSKPSSITPQGGKTPADVPTSLAATDQRILDHYDRHHADADAEQENADRAATEGTGGAATTFRRDPNTRSGFPREIEDQFTPAEMAQLKQRGILRLADGSQRLTGHEAAGGADAMGEAGMGSDRYVAMLRRRLDDSRSARLDRAVAFAKQDGGDPHVKWLAAYRETLLPPGERPPQVSVDPRAQPVGTEMTVNGIPVKVASEGGETILKDHGDLPDTPVEHLDGPIAVDKGSVKAPGERKSFLDRIADAGDAAMARIAQRNTGATPKSGLDPRDAADLAMVGAGLLAKGVRGLKTFTEELAKLIGDHVRPHARDVYRQSRDIFLKERTADEVYERAAAEQLKGRTVGGDETTRQTVRRTSGQTDRSPATGATESEALTARLKAQAAGARAGYREGAADATAAERNRQATREYSAPETVPLSRAIKASMTIRAQGEAAVAKLKDKMEVGQDVRDQLTAAAQELPREIRGDFLTAVRDARTPTNLHRALDRMDAAIADYRQRAATRDLLDVVGRAAKDKPAEQKLVSKVEELAGIQRPDRPVRVNPAKMRPEHEAAVAPLVKAIRTEGKATGAAGLARFINEQTEAGRSNAFDKATLNRLFHLEGKPLGSMAPEDMELIGNAVQHVANLSDRYNKVEFAGRMVDAGRAGDRIMAEVAKRHAEPLADEDRTPEKSSVARAAGDVHRDLSRLAITAGGKPAEEAFYTNIYKGENAANGLKFEAQDAMKAVREEHGIKDADLVKLSNDRVEVPLAGGRRPLSLTPMERAEFVAHWEDADTRQEILKAGFVPKRFKGTPSRVVRVDAADAQAIVDSATPFERAYAAKAREFLNGPMREAVNAASVKDVGFAVARKDDYFPRSRDMTGSNIRPDQKGWHQAWLENIGALKERTGSAKSPVVVGNLHETFDRHVDQTSRYAHLSAPVRDALYLLGGGGGEPGIGQDLVERLGPKWRDRMIDFLHEASGMKAGPEEPGLGFSKKAASALAVGELGFRFSSVINHWMGGSLFAHDLSWGEAAEFLKAVANPKNAFDNAYHDRMADASPYFRNRHEQNGIALTSPAAVGDTLGQLQRGPVGRGLEKVRDVSTALLKWGDARDVVTLTKGLEASYKKENPTATPEEAFKAALDKAEYVVRRNGTASSPLDMSWWNLKAKHSSFGTLATLFTSKISKFRNAVDESYHDFKAEPSKENAARLARATGLVALNTVLVSLVRSGFSAQRQGFPDLDEKQRHEKMVHTVLEGASELADTALPGAGHVLRSAISVFMHHDIESPTILGSTINQAAQDFVRAAEALRDHRNDKAVLQSLRLAGEIGKLAGVPVDAPIGYAMGLYRQFNPEPQPGAAGRARSHPHQRGR